MIDTALFESSIPGLPAPRRGKVRDIYDLGDNLLLVATDRISAFDSVLPTPIPDKGRILTALTLFWLDYLKDIVPNHLISDSLGSLNLADAERRALQGRSLLVKKADVVPFECIVRGYVAGSGWTEYAEKGSVGCVLLPPGLKMSDELPEPIFTPSTKAESGHDQNVPFRAMVDALGNGRAGEIRDIALALYRKAARLARKKGIIIADTKFEFGVRDGQILLIDEVLTPDSSRFWPASEWRAGETPPSFDKQYLRDWLKQECHWNGLPPAPPLPGSVVAAVRSRYIEAYELLSGSVFA